MPETLKINLSSLPDNHFPLLSKEEKNEIETIDFYHDKEVDDAINFESISDFKKTLKEFKKLKTIRLFIPELTYSTSKWPEIIDKGILLINNIGQAFPYIQKLDLIFGDSENLADDYPLDCSVGSKVVEAILSNKNLEVINFEYINFENIDEIFDACLKLEKIHTLGFGNLLLWQSYDSSKNLYPLYVEKLQNKRFKKLSFTNLLLTFSGEERENLEYNQWFYDFLKKLKVDILHLEGNYCDVSDWERSFKLFCKALPELTSVGKIILGELKLTKEAFITLFKSIQNKPIEVEFTGTRINTNTKEIVQLKGIRDGHLKAISQALIGPKGGIKPAEGVTVNKNPSLPKEMRALIFSYVGPNGRIQNRFKALDTHVTKVLENRTDKANRVEEQKKKKQKLELIRSGDVCLYNRYKYI